MFCLGISYLGNSAHEPCSAASGYLPVMFQPQPAPAYTIPLSTPPPVTRPSALLAGFRRWLTQLNRSPRTVDTYSQLLARYFQHLERTPWPSHAAAWLGWEAPAQTRRLTGCALRRFADFTDEFSVGTVWFPKHLPARSAPRPNPVPWRTVAAVLKTSRTLYPGRSGSSFRAFVLLLWATGARRTEAATLRQADLCEPTPGRFEVRVKGKGNRYRDIPVPRLLAYSLLSRAHPLSGSLWPGGRTSAIGGPALAKMWRRALAAAHLPRVRLHQLRHARLSRWAASHNPWEYSALSGQSDLNSSKYYVCRPGSWPGLG